MLELSLKVISIIFLDVCCKFIFILTLEFCSMSSPRDGFYLGFDRLNPKPSIVCQKTVTIRRSIDVIF